VRGGPGIRGRRGRRRPGIDDDAEAVAGTGNIDVAGVVGGDLEEDAGVGSAFVVLAGGVEEARAEARQVATRFLSRTFWRKPWMTRSWESNMGRKARAAK